MHDISPSPFVSFASIAIRWVTFLTAACSLATSFLEIDQGITLIDDPARLVILGTNQINIMKSYIIIVVIAVAGIIATGCRHTAQGVGEDVENAGEAIQDKVD